MALQLVERLPRHDHVLRPEAVGGGELARDVRLLPAPRRGSRPAADPVRPSGHMFARTSDTAGFASRDETTAVLVLKCEPAACRYSAVARALTFGRALVGGAVVTAAMLVVLVVQPGGEHASLVMINDTVQAIAPAIAAVACIAAARRSRPGGWRAGWWLLGLSALSWCAGQIVWSWYEMVRGIEAPFPSAADVGYLGAVPLAIAAVLAFPVHAGALRFRAIVDGLILASGVLQVSWAAVLGPTFRNGDGSILEQVIALAYPATDTAVLVVLLVTLTRVPAGRRAPIWLVVGGLAALAIADGSFAYLAVNDSYGTGAITDIGWISGYLLIALGAYRVVTDDRDLERSLEDDRLRLLHATLPFTSVLALVAVIAVRGAQGGALSGFLLWNAIVMALLVVARQLVVITENAGLTRSLESTVRELAVQATHDGLTGLMNRRLLVEHLAGQLEATPARGDMVAVLFVDLDRFKVINDSLGHDAGDSALFAVSRRIVLAAPEGSAVARFGGDEFVVVTRTADVDAALVLAGPRRRHDPGPASASGPRTSSSPAASAWP